MAKSCASMADSDSIPQPDAKPLLVTRSSQHSAAAEYSARFRVKAALAFIFWKAKKVPYHYRIP